MNFSNLKIGYRLALAFGVMIALVCAVGGFNMMQIARVNEGANQLGTSWMPSIKALGTVRAGANGMRRAALRHLIERTPKGKEEQVAKRAKSLNEVLTPALNKYTAEYISSPEEKQLADDFIAKMKAWIAIDDKLIALSDGGESKAAEAASFATNESANAFAAFADALEKDVALNDKGGADETAKAQTTYQRALTVSTVLLVVSVGIGGLLAWLITRSILTPLEQAVRLAETVTSGDLTASVRVEGNDEIAHLLQSLNAMNENLSKVVSQVRNSADSIATGSAQIAVGNADLSQRTEEQAANLEQTAASMEQMNSTVKNNADTARQAAQLATSASAAAERGGHMMSQVVVTMDDITSSSKKIVDIISVIDGIAFQTNILALNAAVEAARAGEQGRGFAVVAGEVRVLAQRSADAAKEIKTLIGASVEKVEVGAKLVGDSGSTMEDIVVQVKRVSDLISEISSATVEQTLGIGQVSDAVTQLDQVTQQNAALVEESSAAADSLKHQAAQLSGMVSVFKLGQHGHSPTSFKPSHVAPSSSTKAPTPKAPTPKPASKPSSHKATAPAASAYKAPAARVEPTPQPPSSNNTGGQGEEHNWETF